jgi:hypothetical protein
MLRSITLRILALTPVLFVLAMSASAMQIDC